MTRQTYTLKVPKTFFDDHENRALVTQSGDNYIIERKPKHFIVELHMEDALELISDANHYSIEWRYMGVEFIGLGRSATATVKSVAKQMYEQGYRFIERDARRYNLRQLFPEMEFALTN